MNIASTIISASLMAVVGIQGAKLAASQAVGAAKSTLRAEARTALSAAKFALDDGVLLDGPWGENGYCSLDIGDFDPTSYSRPATATCQGLGQEVTVNTNLPCESCAATPLAEEPTT